MDISYYRPLVHLKQWIVSFSSLPPPLLHFLIGIAVYAAVLAVTRRPGWALIVVTIMAVVNELNDAFRARSFLGYMPEAMADTISTIALPALITWLLMRKSRP